MNKKIITYYLGHTLYFQALFLMVPFAVGLIYGESVAFYYFHCVGMPACGIYICEKKTGGQHLFCEGGLHMRGGKLDSAERDGDAPFLLKRGNSRI